jgi:hypothetical protein
VTAPEAMANEATSGKAVGKATSREPAKAETSAPMASAAAP